MRVPDLELEDLAQSGGNRSQLRRAETRRNHVAGRGQAFADQSAGKIDISGLVEIDPYRGQPKARNRADVVDPRQTAHRNLDREGDELLDLGRAQSGRIGD